MSDTQQSAPNPSSAAPPPPPPSYAPVAPRRMVRTLDDKWLGGVCGGLARYANLDPTLVRVLTVIAGVVFFPVPLLAYLLLWVVMPTV